MSAPKRTTYFSEYVDREDYLAVAELRRDIWVSGYRWAAFGLAFGVFGYVAATRLSFLRAKLPWVEPKHGMLGIMSCFCGGMFLGSLGMGSSNMHRINHVMNRRSHIDEDGFPLPRPKSSAPSMCS